MSDLRLGSSFRSRTGPRETLGPQTGGGLQFDPQLSGNISVTGDVPAALEAAGATSVFAGGPSELISQFLDPQLSSEQQQALDAFRRTAIGRGLSGAGLQAQLRSTQNQLLAGNRLRSIQNIIGEIQGRAGLFQQQVSPFFNDQLRGSAFQNPAARGQIEQSLFGGLTSLGFGNLVQGELFRRTGAGAGGFELGSGGATGELAQAVQQFFNPRLTGEQLQVAPGSAQSQLFEQFRARGIDPATLNRSRASLTLQSTLAERLAQLQGGLSELGVFGLGASLASPEQILSANLDPFQQLFGAAGLV